MKFIFALFFLVLGMSLNAQPVVPMIDPAMKTALRKIFILGKQAGNRPTVFIKVGDSITSSKSFLIDIGCDVEDLADHRELASTVRYFRDTAFPSSYSESWCGVANSFSRTSVTADRGWTTVDPLRTFSNPVSACPAPNNNPLRCELSLLKPSIALVMYGTNDLEFNALNVYRKNLTRVIQEIQVAGVVPVMSTIPPRLDSAEMGRRVESYNQIIREIAETMQVPLWNYWLSLQGSRMVHSGIDNHGIHPNIYSQSMPATFTSEGLRYGFNQRNLTALQVLSHLKTVVQNNGPANSSGPSNFALSPGKLRVSAARGTAIKFFVRIPRHQFTQPVSLELESHPGGITGSFQSNVSGTGALLELTIKSGVVPKDYLLTIVGSGGNLVRKASFVLTVS